METEKKVLSKRIGVKTMILRLGKGMKLEQLAQLIKIDIRHLRRIEKGEVNPSSYLLYSLSETLEYPIQDFFEPIFDYNHNDFSNCYGQFEVRDFKNQKFFWVLMDQANNVILSSPLFHSKEKCVKAMKESKNLLSSYHLQPMEIRKSDFTLVLKNSKGNMMAFGFLKSSQKTIKTVISNLILNLKLL